MESPWILVICHEFPPLGGGAGKNLFLLCRELSRRGLRLRVLTGDPGAAKRWNFDFPVEYLGTGRRCRFETSLRGLFIFAVRAALKACPILGGGQPRDQGPPALVFSGLGIPAGLAGTYVSRRLRVPHAVWYHGSDVHGGRPGGPGRLQRALYRWVSSGAAHNFYISSGLRDLARTLAPSRNTSLLPSCPSPEIRAAAEAAPALASSGTDRYLLYLGRLEEVKNPILLVRAVAVLKARGRPFPRLRMVGGGGLRDIVKAELRKLSLASHATLEPAAAFEQVPELFRGAYALIVPSRAEGFNTTILEAALFGVPTVGADTLGIRDFVMHGRTGLLFSGDDADALADALAALVADPVLRDALGEAARAAATPYRAERVAEDFLRAAALFTPALARYLVPSSDVAPSTSAPGRGAASVHSQETPA